MQVFQKVHHSPFFSREFCEKPFKTLFFLHFPTLFSQENPRENPMTYRLTSRLASRLRQTTAPILTLTRSSPSIPTILEPQLSISVSDLPFALRFLSTARRQPVRSSRVDIGARARQMQNRRLWTYALTFSCIAGFVVIVIYSFQDQLVFYVTPTEVLEKYNANPSKNKFRLGGLVLEGKISKEASYYYTKICEVTWKL